LVSGLFKRHKIVSILLFTALLLISVVSSSSFFASWALNNWLSKHASDVELNELTLSFWNSQLDVKGLLASNHQGKKLSIDALQINWIFSDLWKKKLTISNVIMNGFYLDIQGENYRPEFIGPIDLSKLNTVEASGDNTQTSNTWSISLGSMELSNSVLCYQDREEKFSLTGLPLSTDLKKIDLCVNLKNLQSDTLLTLPANETFRFSGNLGMTDFQITDSDTNKLLSIERLLLDQLSAQAQTSYVKRVTIEGGQLLANERDDSFADTGLSFTQLELSNLNWETTTALFKNMEVKQLVIKQRASDNKIRKGLSLSSLTAKNGSVNQENSMIELITFTEIDLLEKLTPIQLDIKVYPQDRGYLSGFSQIKLQGLNFSNKELNLSDLNLGGFYSWLVIDKSGLNILQWLPQDQKMQEKTEKKDDVFQIDINNISFNTDADIKIIDNRLEKQTIHSLTDVVMDVKNFQLGNKSSQRSLLSFSSTIEDAGKLSGTGYFTSLQDNLELEIIGKILNTDLVKFTHHSAKFTGYRIEQGQLNLDYDVKIKDSIIDADLGIHLEKFALGSLQKHEQSQANEELGIPLPLALNLLRDGDDNIKLDIPITGDVTAPDFSLSSILETVSIKAIKNAVIHYYSPLGMLSIASGIIDLATALRFDPIIFEPQNIALSSKAKQQLDKIVNIMNDKPKVKFVICAQATATDIVQAAEATKNESSKAVNPQPLIELAKQRQKSVMDYLLKSDSITSTRLLGCNVKLSNDPKSPAQVDISI